MSNYLSDLFAGSSVPYPSAPNGSTPGAVVGPYTPQQGEGILRQLFAPEFLPYPYPVPTCDRHPIPPRVPTAAAVAETKPPVVPTLATPRLLTAIATNPEFVSRYAEAHEEYLEDELGEVLTKRMKTYDGEPIAFVVPEGCDAVELFYGPLEANPGVGLIEEVDEVVSCARPHAALITGRLTPGEPFVVAVPWRAASWVDMAAGHLRAKIAAHFFKATCTSQQ